MSKYQIKVEIPDGDYCDEFEKGIFCLYQGDAHYGAGCCVLVVEGDRLIYWDDGDKPFGERSYERIVKHRNCPSRVKLEVKDVMPRM